MSTDAAGYIPSVTVGWRIRMAREHAGLDQRALAERTGIARNTISNYELGATTHVKSLYLRQIAMVTGVDARWLETGQAEPDNGPGLTLLPHLDSNQKPFGFPSAHVLAA